MGLLIGAVMVGDGFGYRRGDKINVKLKKKT